MIEFAVRSTDPSGKARVGTLTTHHGCIETPTFMPVGSLGTVKGVDPSDLHSLGFGLILNNAYHLYLRPGRLARGDFDG